MWLWSCLLSLRLWKCLKTGQIVKTRTILVPVEGKRYNHEGARLYMYCTVIIVIVFGVDMHCIYIMIIMIILGHEHAYDYRSWSFITLTHDRNKSFSHLWSGNANDWGPILPDFSWTGFSEGGPNQSQLCADHVINLTVQTAWHKVIASWWFGRWQVGKRRGGLLVVTIIMTRIIMCEVSQ